MSVRIPLEGKKFERLLVLKYLGSRPYGRDGKHHKGYYQCRCDCGKEVEVEAQNLRCGNSKSCGCYWLDHHSGENSNLYKGVGKLRAEYNRQIRGAIKRKLEFTLTLEQTETLFNGVCYYCNSTPVKDHRGLVRNGIDRIDSSRGYILDNVISCCSICNVMKSNYTAKEFVEHMQKINANMSQKKPN
jgi:hypothetical protein